MEFLEQVVNQIGHQLKSSAITPFSYFIESEKIKIHYVRVEHFNASTYCTAVQLLKANHSFFITVFEDQFKLEPQKVIERLKYHIGESKRIHGRDTKVEKITKPEAYEFLNQNHSNVPLKAKYNYGLKNKSGDLVTVASFGQVINMRKGNKSSELIRFCNKLGYRTVGGLSKLLLHFKNNHNIDELMTYCDAEWSDGKSYEKLEFVKIDDLPPTNFVIHLPTWKRTHADKFQKENDINSLNFDEYRTVQNLGSIKFIKTFND